MLGLTRIISCLLFMFTGLFSYASFASENLNIPILCYHNLNPIKPGSMNLTPQKFESQIKWLKDNGFSIVPLNDVVDYLQGKRQTLPAKPIVVTADDGWESVYTYMWPIVRKYNIPVTLFIYPETISQGKHSMTWEQLKELKQTGLFTIQGHTYSHPNFKQEKKHRSLQSYDQFVQNELVKSKQILENKLAINVNYLAWPFGIYNDSLEQAAAKAGYAMSFTIGARPVNRSYKPQEEPRYMIIDAQSAKTFAAIANSGR